MPCIGSIDGARTKLMPGNALVNLTLASGLPRKPALQVEVMKFHSCENVISVSNNYAAHAAESAYTNSTPVDCSDTSIASDLSPVPAGVQIN